MTTVDEIQMEAAFSHKKWKQIIAEFKLKAGVQFCYNL